MDKETPVSYHQVQFFNRAAKITKFLEWIQDYRYPSSLHSAFHGSPYQEEG
jgi:hypothetical protein